MKITLISTVLNEGDNIRQFLDGLLDQTRPADEIIIVDGGSIDGTAERIQGHIDSGRSIRLIIAPTTNIAQGRNLAITEASGDIIACTDAGSFADSNWLAEITAPFNDPSVDVAAGISLTAAGNRKEKSFGTITLSDIDDIDSRSLNPSSRSLAFRKTIWDKVGGYPEELCWAEDSLFNHRLHRVGAKFVFCPKAIIYWQPQPTLPKTARQFFRYGRGDGQALLYHRVYIIILIKMAWVLGLVVAGLYTSRFWMFLFLCLAIYYLRLLFINRRRGSVSISTLVFIHRPILDAARLAGYLYGRIEGSRNPKFSTLRNVTDSIQSGDK